MRCVGTGGDVGRLRHRVVWEVVGGALAGRIFRTLICPCLLALPLVACTHSRGLQADDFLKLAKKLRQQEEKPFFGLF